MAVISATGDWTPITGLSLGRTGEAGPAGLNRPIALGLNFESLKTPDGVILPELRDFIQAMATGYGLSFWAAADLAEVLMRALRNSATPMQLGGDVGGGQRLYIP